jgi:hypothetical protein
MVAIIPDYTQHPKPEAARNVEENIGCMRLGYSLRRDHSFGGRGKPRYGSLHPTGFDKGYTILNSTSLSEAERRDQFRALLLQLAASRRVALFALGPYASGAKPSKLNAFVEALTV